jgi:hypothetical protein
MGDPDLILARKSALYVLLVLAGLVILASCRRETPSLFDLNREPNTFLTNAPPETSDTDFLVHFFWRGTDDDGVVTKYIWAVTDTVLPPEGGEDNPLNWNPANRLDDRLNGHFTQQTDSVFIFKGYREVGGSGVLRARQVFNIAAVDDNGRIDTTPARIQFFANARGFPKVFFTLAYTPRFPKSGPPPPVQKPLCRGCTIPHDTIGMYQDFTLTWHGNSPNGSILGYQWIDRGITYPDLNGDGLPEFRNYPQIDTVLQFSNSGADVLQSGIYTLFMTALDEAQAKSQNERAQVVVNFDPDSRATNKATLWYRMKDGTVVNGEEIDLTDSDPDTIPYKAIIKLEFAGWDSPFDSLRPPEPIRISADSVFNPPFYNPLRFAFRFNFRRETGTVPPVVTGQIPWTPSFDTDPAQDPVTFVDTDSISLNVGSATYFLQVRSQDENQRFDGTPDTVEVHGNYPPTIDSVGVYFIQPTDPLQAKVYPADTLRLDLLGSESGLGFDFATGLQIFSIDESTNVVRRTYEIHVAGTGTDHPKDPPGSAVKAWQFEILDPDTSVKWGAERTWTNGPAPDEADFIVRVPVTSVGHINRGDALGVIDALQKYALVDSDGVKRRHELGDQNVTLIGRDTATIEAFSQLLRQRDPASGEWVLEEINKFNVALLGRTTRKLNRPLVIKVVP